MKTPEGKRLIIWDANNYRWVWIEKECRVVLDLPEEIADPQSGYPAWTAEDALEVLYDGGYMDGEFNPNNTPTIPDD